ncbi:MAG: threonylcarbamoyl-AMP synthase, partial [Gemmatimonadaceae bacterium]|nr:threonylcarbamoyl-AMP synthase [Gemmatimonadaceae bacterium]
NPIIVHIADASSLRAVARDVPPMAEALARAFWPGPLTLVLPRVPEISDAVSAGLDSVGVRVPAHPVARALIERSGVPIAAPSANPYTRVSPTTASHVIAQLGDVVDLVLDGGACQVGIESTVVDVTGPRPILLRPGGLSRDEIERVVGPVEHPAVLATGDAPRPAPGMVERHYAPHAQLVAFRPHERTDVWERMATLVGSGRRVGIVAFDVTGAPATCAIAMPPDPEGYARAMYATLHTLDREGCTIAFVEGLPSGRGWEAIRDRWRRAGVDRTSGS